VTSPESLAGFTSVAWVLMALAALLIGVAKTSIGGVAMVSVALFAAVLPARASTGVVLLLLLVGDAFALRAYTHHADRHVLRRLAPSAIVGVTLGTAFLFVAGDLVVRRAISAVLVALVLVSVTGRLTRRDDVRPAQPWVVHGAGSLSGFTSMVANAGGSVMSLYLLRLNLPVLTFLGTSAWFFFAVNVVKLPMSIAIGLVRLDTLVLALVLAPGVLVGAWLGRSIAHRISLKTFEWVVLSVTLVAAVNLLR